MFNASTNLILMLEHSSSTCSLCFAFTCFCDPFFFAKVLMDKKDLNKI